MTDTPPDRHPRSKVTRLPYVVVVLIALIAVAIWGALTVRERNTADRETVGIGDDPAHVEQVITKPPPR